MLLALATADVLSSGLPMTALFWGCHSGHTLRLLAHTLRLLVCFFISFYSLLLAMLAWTLLFLLYQCFLFVFLVVIVLLTGCSTAPHFRRVDAHHPPDAVAG